VTGAFLTFVLCIGDYITPQILGGNTELTLPQVIMLQLGRRADFPLASALAVVLMAVVTLAYFASQPLAAAGPDMTRALPWAYLARRLRLHLPAGGGAGPVLVPGRPLPVPPFQRALAATGTPRFWRRA
jgi:ABC-type Fe3+ transport system permease subunit